MSDVLILTLGYLLTHTHMRARFGGCQNGRPEGPLFPFVRLLPQNGFLCQLFPRRSQRKDWVLGGCWIGSQHMPSLPDPPTPAASLPLFLLPPAQFCPSLFYLPPLHLSHHLTCLSRSCLVHGYNGKVQVLRDCATLHLAGVYFMAVFQQSPPEWQGCRIWIASLMKALLMLK